MRSRVLHLLILALVLAGCLPATPAPVPTPVPTENAEPPTMSEAPWSDRSVFESGLPESQQAVLEGLPGASVYHLDLTIAFDLQTVDGAEEIFYTNTETTPLEQVGIHLFPNLLGGEMTLSTLRVDGVDVEPAYGAGDGSLMVPLAPALEPGATTVLQIDFRVRLPQDLQLNYGVLAATSGVIAYAHGYPMVAVYDSDGWNVDLPPRYGDITYADASFYLVRVRAPADLVLCGSGVQISHSESNGQQEATLAVGPARDFYLAGSREYQLITRTSGETTIRTCAPSGTSEVAERILDIAEASLEAFSRWYAPYPYTKLDIIATPNLALGIEYPGAFALNQLLLTPDEDFGGTPEAVLLESVTVHEAAHAWFYNLVGNDQLEDPWLDEAMAQYATLQYYADRYGTAGASGLRESFYGRWDLVGREAIPIGKPVAEYDEAEYGAIVYGRGPLFFDALHDRMGEAGFNSFLRKYTAAFSWEEATPQDLQQIAEAECGCDLDDLFDAWVY